MNMSDHKKIIQDIDITKPVKERVECYQEKLKEHGCDFNRIKYNELGLDIEVEYNGKAKRNILEYITAS